MKQLMPIILIVMVIALQSVPITVKAANSQGLEWNYGSSSKRFYPGSFLIHPGIPELNPIPEIVTTWEDIPIVHAEIVSDRELDVIAEKFEYLPHAGNRLFLPIGNWNLFSDLIADEFDDVTVDDRQDTWGFSLNYSVDVNRTAVLSVTYEREDGWIWEYKADVYNSTGDLVEQSHTFQRSDSVQDFIDFLPGPLVGAIFLVVLFFGCMASKRLGPFKGGMPGPTPDYH